MTRFFILLSVSFLFTSSGYAQSWQELMTASNGNVEVVSRRIDLELSKDPNSLNWQFFRSRASTRLRDFEMAAKAYEACYRISPKNVIVQNAYAWFLATVPEQRLRNPSKALALAKKACEQTKYKSWQEIDTLAASHAANGDFKIAEIYQKEAVECAPKDDAPLAEANLQLFRQGKTIKDGFIYEGYVWVTNNTSYPIDIVSTGWKSAAGENVGKVGTWSFKAKQSSRLVFGSKTFQANEFRYHVKTANGRTPEDQGKVWVTRYLGGGKLEVIVDESMLPRQRVVVAKPVIPDTDPIQEGLDTIKEIAETAKKAKKTYDEVRSLFPKKKTASSSTNSNKLSADLILNSVSLASRKSNGKKWDSWLGKNSPDIQVVVSVSRNGSTYRSESSEVKDSLYGSFNEKLIRIQEGDQVTITVYDRDAEDHDVAGSYTKSVTSALIREKSATWSFDQVEEFNIKFEY